MKDAAITEGILGITTDRTTDTIGLGRKPQSVEAVIKELRTTTRLNRQKQHDKRGVGQTPRGEELKE